MPKSSRSKMPVEQVVKDIRRKTRRHFSAEDKIRIVLDGLRGDDSIAELCRREGIAQSLYYTWSKEFMEAGKRRLAGDTARAATTDEEGSAPGGPRSEGVCGRPHPGEPTAQKKHDRGWGRRRMRYPASEKLEIIRIVEQSHLPAKRTLDQLGVARRTFYRWYDRYLEGGPEALADRPSAPSRVWNRIGDNIQQQIVEMALEQTELSQRELAVRFRAFKSSPPRIPSYVVRECTGATSGTKRPTLKRHSLRHWRRVTSSQLARGSFGTTSSI